VTVEDPYSRSRIRRGIAFLVGGKGLTSFAGIATFLVLVRSLPIEQFAVYTVLFALIELIEALTSIGFAHILLRYAPELYAEHRASALRKVIALCMAVRLATLLSFLGLLFLLTPHVAPLIGLADWEWALQAYLAAIFMRVTITALYSLLESMLHQGVAQLGFGLVTVLRFVLLLLASTQGPLDLQTVILIEVVTDVIGCTVMLIGLYRALPAGRDPGSDDGTGWIQANRRRMLRFGVKAYLQSLLVLPYGAAANRLIVGSALPSESVALFGFAQSIGELMERYLPVKLLAGVIRPVLTVRYVQNKRFADLELAANLIFKINATLVCLAAVVIYAGAEPMLSLLTAGKYAEQSSVILLLLMCGLVLMASLRYMLDHVSHVVEQNGPLIWSNAVIASSMLLGIALLPTLGVYALPVASLLGYSVGIGVLIWRLRAKGFSYRHDLTGLARLVSSTGIGMASAEITRWSGGGWIEAIVIALVAFGAALALLRPARPQERELLMSMIRGRSAKGA
jgi:O-antigen/teichoic acid export membrane protein